MLIEQHSYLSAIETITNCYYCSIVVRLTCVGQRHPKYRIVAGYLPLSMKEIQPEGKGCVKKDCSCTYNKLYRGRGSGYAIRSRKGF